VGGGAVSKSRLDYSLAVDVYSFAIVLFERRGGVEYSNDDCASVRLIVSTQRAG
jgi:hypothetical protein